MKKKKSTEVLLSPVQYWEMKLNINFETFVFRIFSSKQKTDYSKSSSIKILLISQKGNMTLCQIREKIVPTSGLDCVKTATLFI